MANSKEYKVNSIGHWQGLEEVIEEVVAGEGNPIPDEGIVGELENLGNTVSEKLDEVEQGLSTVISTESENIVTELGKLENGQTSASSQLTEIETLITGTNTAIGNLQTNTVNEFNDVQEKLNAIATTLNSVEAALGASGTIAGKLDRMIALLQTIATNTTPSA